MHDDATAPGEERHAGTVDKRKRFEHTTRTPVYRTKHQWRINGEPGRLHARRPRRPRQSPCPRPPRGLSVVGGVLVAQSPQPAGQIRSGSWKE
ncbi:hypothetical protein SSCG_04834 [Streptomyces clavuligerus]|nr:hypothetical protein SSCG_04834 [Streptomyces clavuligerus]